MLSTEGLILVSTPYRDLLIVGAIFSGGEDTLGTIVALATEICVLLNIICVGNEL
jgi:hypothetical protein